MKPSLKVLLLTIATLSFALIPSAPAAPGDVDPGFDPNANSPNTNSTVRSTAVQPDAKIVIGGVFTSVSGVTRNKIARLNADGSLDTGFNPDASNIPSFSVSSTGVQADGKIVIGGSFASVGGVTRNRMARLNADGTLDTGFNPNVGFSGVFSTALQVDGKIVIGGFFTSVSGVTRNYIARLNADGTLDTGFNPNANAAVDSTALQADGKIVIGGAFTSVGGLTRNRIARLNADGTLDTGFNPNANAAVDSTALQADGKIVIGGSFTSVGGVTRNGIARLNADGTLDTGFNPNANAAVDSTALQADGKIVIGGFFTTISGLTRNRIARLNADGTLDTGFNPNANAAVDSTALQADGKIVVGGAFTMIGALARNGIARLENGAATQSLTVPSNARVQWARGGASPEVEQVTFEVSTDGSSYTPLGFGTRIAGGWERTGLTLPPTGWIRARGRTSGGENNGSSGLVEEVAPFAFAAPTVTTGSATGVTTATATLGGTVNPNRSATIARFEYGLTTAYGSIVNVTPPGSGDQPVAVSAFIGGLQPNQTYHFRLTATNNAGTSGGPDRTFTTQASPPTTITGPPTNVTGTGATLSGTINPNNTGVTASFFEYGLTAAYGSTAPATPPPGSGGQPVAVSATISGLQPNQTYHFRLVATNSQGTGQGADMTFVTGPGVPVVATGPATNVTTSGATLSGTVNPNGALVTSAIFEYGLTTAYGSTASASPAPGSGTAPAAVSATLSGLAANQTYHYRLTATNSLGTSSGVDGTFLTGATAPTVTTGGSSNISASGATISGTVNPNGSATTAAFEYGLDTTYGNTATATPPPGSGTAPVTVSATIAGLSPNRIYHYRLTANSQGGLASGTDATFTTSASLPTVQTQQETNVTTNGATLHGLVNPNNSATTARFEYGITTNYGSSVAITPAPGSGDQPVAVSAFIGGLQPNQIYHFRLTATNNAGTSGGTDVTFTTAASPPTTITGPPTNVTGTGATLNGTINPNNTAVTASFFEYGLTTAYGSIAPATPLPGSGDQPAAVSATISGLQPNQTYHFRLVATNSQGTDEGADMSFVTGPGVPVVATGPATNVTTTGATLSGTVNPNGALVTSAIFEYGLTTAYGTTASASPAPGSGTAPVAVSATLSGLAPNQTYHYRLTATNSLGTSSGVDGTFLTGATAPTVTTGGSSNISASGATISGTVNPNGSATTAAFEYGLDTTYGNAATATPSPGSGTAPVTVSATIAGLSPNRIYHYRLTANSQGGFASGTDATFTTSASLPSVQTQQAMNVTTSGANLHGLVNPNNSATTARFEYGLTTAYGSIFEVTPPGSGDQPVAVSAFIGGLQPNQTYHFRLAATNQVGTAGGVDLTFTTAASPPTTVTSLPTNVTNTGAILNGTVNPNGSVVTSTVFEIGLTTSYGTEVPVASAPGGERAPVNVSANVGGLQPAQTYHYRLTARNSAGSSSGSDETFTTGVPAPAVTTGAFSNLTATGVTLGGTVNPNGFNTTATFEYGLDTTYGTSVSSSSDPGSGTEPVPVNATLNGLIPNRLYHYRLTATNAGGLGAGQDETFSTPPFPPAVETTEATLITPTGAMLNGRVNPNDSATTAHFLYRVKDTQTFLQTQPDLDAGAGTVEVPVSATISGLEPFTAYQYLIEARNALGTSVQGDLVDFKTPAEELVVNPDEIFVEVGGGAIPVDVLANDQGTGLQIVNATGRGVTFSAGTITFTPAPSLPSDPESFTYSAQDVAGNSAPGTVTVYYLVPSRGTYFDNAGEPNGARVLRARIDLMGSGALSGRLEWEREQYAFKDQLESDGMLRVNLAREGSGGLESLFLELSLDPDAQSLVGTFRDTGPLPVSFPIDLDLLPVDPNPVLPDGTQIAFIDPETDEVGAAVEGGSGAEPLPAGIGFSKITLKGGRARFITKMPDFGTFTKGFPLLRQGEELPRYAINNVKYKRDGKRLGEISGDALPQRPFGEQLDRISSVLSVMRGGQVAYFGLLEGFRLVPGLDGRPRGFPRSSNPNATIRLSGGGLADRGLLDPAEFKIFIANGKAIAAAEVTDPNYRTLKLNLNLRSGTFSGSIQLPTSAVPGALHEKVRIAGGMPGGVGLTSVLGAQPADLRGSFFVKSTKRTGKIKISPIAP